MSEIQEYLTKIENLAEHHGDYKAEAYNFVLAGLNHVMTKLEKPRHLTGQELSKGIRDYAVEQFGPMAKTVMDYWGIKETFDYGVIVYRLIDAELMTKTEEDSVEDFRDVFDFKSFFGAKYDFLAYEDSEKS